MVFHSIAHHTILVRFFFNALVSEVQKVAENMKAKNIFKAFVAIISLPGLSYHLYSIISSFLEYKFTESTFEKRGKLIFPDISICNMRGISASNLRTASKNSSKVKEFMHQLNDPKALDHDIPYLPDLVAFLGDDARRIGHRKHDLILNCLFDGTPCKSGDFVQFSFPLYVNCYKFVRGRHSSSKIRSVNGTGLTAVVYLEPEDIFTSKLNSHTSFGLHSVGVGVLLTPHNLLATIGFSANEAGPGLSTSFGFTTTEHTRLPEPFNHCTHTTKKTGKLDVPYSFVECRNDCVHAIVFSECGCQSTKYLVRSPTNISSCGEYIFKNKTLSASLLQCQNRAISKTQKTTKYVTEKCQCFWPCSDTRFSIKISQSTWPARHSMKTFLHKTLEMNPRRKKLKAYKHYQLLKSLNASEDAIYSWVSNHFLRLRVFARSDLVFVIEETPLYTMTDVFSSIGGCLGLWVGASVLTLSKVCDYLAGVAARLVRRRGE